MDFNYPFLLCTYPNMDLLCTRKTSQTRRLIQERGWKEKRPYPVFYDILAFAKIGSPSLISKGPAMFYGIKRFAWLLPE